MALKKISGTETAKEIKSRHSRNEVAKFVTSDDLKPMKVGKKLSKFMAAKQFKFTKLGDWIDGTIVAIVPTIISGNIVPQLYFQREDGVYFILMQRQIERFLKDYRFPFGAYLKVTLVDYMPMSGRNDMMVFDFEFEDTLEVSPVPIGITNAADAMLYLEEHRTKLLPSGHPERIIAESRQLPKEHWE